MILVIYKDPGLLLWGPHGSACFKLLTFSSELYLWILYPFHQLNVIVKFLLGAYFFEGAIVDEH